MTKEELLKILNNTEYPAYIPHYIRREIYDSGLVIIFNDYDNFIEIEGAISTTIEDESLYISPEGKFILESDYQGQEDLMKEFIKFEFIIKEGFIKEYKTKLPHLTFNLYEDDNPTEVCSKGLIFDMKDLKNFRVKEKIKEF